MIDPSLGPGSKQTLNICQEIVDLGKDVGWGKTKDYLVKWSWD